MIVRRAAIGLAVILGVGASACAADVPGDGAGLGPVDYANRARLTSVEFIEFIQTDVRISTIVERPGDDHLYAVRQVGRVVQVDRPTLDDLNEVGQLAQPPAGREALQDVVLDIVDMTQSEGEEGLVGLAFDPTGSLAYVHHSRAVDGHSSVAEYTVDDDGMFDPASRRELFVVEQSSANHNAGQLLFGPDGYLYLAFGDGSPYADLDRKALNLESPLGKILRIDPTASADAPYSVPADNPLHPFPDADTRIWAWGLRNPFSFSFDAVTGDMWIADVGQAAFEEINFAPATDGRDAGRGRNFGWSAFEGPIPYNDDQSKADHTGPLITYAHEDYGDCGSVSDGLVVRNSAVESLNDWYTYGDWCSGIVWAYDPFQPDADPVVIANMPGFTQMLQTADGNLYASSQQGEIALVVPG